MGELFGSSVKSLLQQDPPPVPNEAELLDAVVQKVGPFADRDKLCYHIRISAGKVHWAVNSYFRSILATAWPAREDFDSKPSSSQQQQATADRQTAEDVAAHAAATVPATTAGSFSGNADSRQQQQAAGSSSCGASSGNTAQQPSEACVETCCCSADATGAPADAPSSAAAAAAAAASPAVQLDALPGSVLECVLSYLELPCLLHAAASCKALHRAAQSEQLWRQLFLQRWGAVLFPTSKHSCRVISSRGAAGRAAVGRDAGYGVRGPIDARSAGAAAAAAAAAAEGVHGADGTGSSGRQQSTTAAAAARLGDVVKAGSSTAGRLASRHAPACSSSNSAAFVSRWTGSCLAGPAPLRAVGGASSSSGPLHALPSLLLPNQQQQQQQQQHQQLAAQPAAAGTRCSSSQQAATAANSTGAGRRSCGCPCGSPAVLPAAAPSGSWRLQYKQQHSYQSVRRCPKCGEATVVPIVYGFPSGPLLAGMGLKRLVLGGDHLIDSCHVWACSGCRSCFRFFPYADVQLWLQDDEAQQRWDQARAAAGRSSGRRGAGGGAAAAGSGSEQQGGREAEDEPADVAQADAAAAAAGFPRYTYEL
uniref:F-box domain-containing protein n=1 Tax=Tetradesmus obliquus TaxID=3088 RepID=A0A383V607_TETOB|eukprot:jgi/Sobl393_1/14182/SZX60159.1